MAEAPGNRLDLEKGIFSAIEMQSWRWKNGGAPGIMPPEAAIFCLQADLFQRAKRHYRLNRIKGLFGDSFLLKTKQGQVALSGGFGLGSPAMAILVEEYIAFGTIRFLSIGTAGALTPDLFAGDIVVCESAIRGEGTSSHYLPPSATVEADHVMVQGISSLFNSTGLRALKGSSWTTDAPYRETRREAGRYRQEGVLCVDMEAAGLFAASKSLGACAAAVFVIADRLLEGGWEPPETSKPVMQSLGLILDIVIPWMARGVP